MQKPKDNIAIGFLFSTIGPYATLGREGHDGALTANWTEDEVAALGHRAAGHYSTAPYWQSVATPANADLLATAAQDVSASQAYKALRLMAMAERLSIEDMAARLIDPGAVAAKRNGRA